MQSPSHSTQSNRPGCATLIPRIFFAVALLFLILVGLGMVYEARARAEELSRVSPPGQMVQVDDRQMHILCLGEKEAGEPTVVLESGVGSWSMYWHSFQQEVAKMARVCSYDRAGYGWSEPGPLPRDGEQIASELHALLEGAGESGPYLLVGASRGGQYVRIYRAAYPDEVAGMVLVDGEPEDLRFRSAAVKTVADQNETIFSVLGGLMRIGFFRVLGSDPAQVPAFPCLPYLLKYLPPETHEAYLAVEGQPACFDTLFTEEAATERRESQVREAGDLDDLPLIVLSRTTPTDISGPQEEVEATWQELQQEMATLSTQGQLIQATDSGHDIALEEPELVLEAIRSLLEKLDPA